MRRRPVTISSEHARRAALRAARKAGRRTWIAAVLSLWATAAVAQAPVAERLYVADSGGDAVLAVDPPSGGTLPIRLGDAVRAEGLDVSPRGDVVYVSSIVNNAVLVLDAATMTIAKRIAIDRPSSVRFAPRGDVAFVRTNCGSTVVIDATRHEVAGTLPLGTDYRIRAFGPDGRQAYAVREHSYSLAVVDVAARTVVGNIAFPDEIRGVVASTDGTALYVRHARWISVVDAHANRVTGTIHVDQSAQFAVAPDGRLAYTRQGSVLGVVDLAERRVVRSVAVSPGWAIVFAPSGRAAYLLGASAIEIVDTSTHAVVGRIPFEYPVSMLVTPDESRAYVLHNGTDGAQPVSIVDLAGAAVVASTAASGYLISWGLLPSGGLLLATTDGVWVIDANGREAHRRLADTRPVGLAASADGASLYVPNQGADTIDVVDTATATVRATIPPPADGGPRRVPVHVAPSADGTLLYVAYERAGCCAPGSVAIYDAQRLQLLADVALEGHGGDEEYSGTYGNWGQPYRIALSADGSTAYVAMSYSLVAVLDTARRTVTHRIWFGDYDVDAVRGLALAPDGSRVYAGLWQDISDSDQAFAVVMDTATKGVMNRIALPGKGPGHIAISPDGATAYMAQVGWGHEEGLVSVIDLATETVTATIPLPAIGDGIALSGDGATAYVALPATGQVAVIDTATRTLARLLPAGLRPTDVAVAAPPLSAPVPPTPQPLPTPTATLAAGFDDLVVVAHRSDNAVSIIDANGTRTMPFWSPSGVAVHPDGTTAYVAAHQPTTGGSFDSVLAALDVSTGALRWSVDLPGGPEGVALTPDGALLYVAVGSLTEDGWKAALAIVDTAARAVVHETILPMPHLPRNAAVTPDGRYVYAATEAGVAAVDTRTSTVVNLTASTGPYAEAIATDGRLVYVAGSVVDPHQLDGIRVLDAETLEPASPPVPVLAGPQGLAAQPDGSALFVASNSVCASDLSVYDPVADAMVATVHVADLSLGLAFGSRVWLALNPNATVVYSADSESVVAIDTARLQPLARVALPFPAWAIAVGCRGDCSPPPTMPRTPPALVPTSTPTRTPTITPMPGTPRMMLELTSAIGAPGERVEYAAIFREDFAAGYMYGVQHELWLDRSLSFASWQDGTPDCESDLAPPARTRFQLLPEGCDAARDCRGLRVLTEDAGWFPGIWDGLELYRCRLDIAPDAPPGFYALTPTAVVLGAWNMLAPPRLIDGVVAVIGPGATPGPRPTATPTVPIEQDIVRLSVQAHSGVPGEPAELTVEMYQSFGADSAAVVQHDLLFDPRLAAAGPGGRPDCAVGDESTAGSFVFHPPGCTPGLDCAGLRVALQGSWQRVEHEGDGWLRLNERRTLYTCALAVSADAPPGVYPLRFANVSVDGIGVASVSSVDGVLAVVVPPGATPLPTRTPGPPASPRPSCDPGGLSSSLICLTDTGSRAGERVLIDATLRSNGHRVAGVQLDLSVPPPLSFATSALGRPDCRANPDIGKNGSSFSFAPAPCDSDGVCARVRALVLALDNVDPIPDGSRLFSCALDVPPGTAAGVYRVEVTGALASDPTGGVLSLLGIDGAVRVAGAPTRTPTTTHSGSQEGVGGAGARSTGGCEIASGAGPSLWMALGPVLPLLLLRRRQARVRGV